MSIEDSFTKQGGVFLSTAKEMASKLKQVRCFVFDWDGVFNNGIKANQNGSPFSEPDSMGLNMLRFSYWLLHGELPITAIITGENNLTAVDFAKREHLHAVYLNSKNKAETILQLANNYGINPDQIAFVFDDILDLNAVEICLLSFCVKRKASPLFNEFIAKEKFCHYISSQEGGNHAVREITELMIGLHGNYRETIEKRMKYQGDYEQYLALRNALTVELEKRFTN